MREAQREIKRKSRSEMKYMDRGSEENRWTEREGKLKKPIERK